MELLKCFVDLNYDKKSPWAEGPMILYCAPSNKAVNVGACKMMPECYSGSGMCIKSAIVCMHIGQDTYTCLYL